MRDVEIIKNRISDSIEVKQRLLADEDIINAVESIANHIADAIAGGGKLLLCGNGGSASDALHFAGEIVGRFKQERKAWPAVVLNADVATMTAVANDYGYDEVFARQVEAHMTDRDILVGISTSGNSGNIIKAVYKAHRAGGRVVALTGGNGGTLAEIADDVVIVPDSVTARIQESHIMIIHIICELVELKLGLENVSSDTIS